MGPEHAVTPAEAPTHALRPETHSIDYVPQSERHGKVWHQGPFWFMGQFVPTVPVVGFIGPLLGLDLLWSVVASVAGVLFGTIFVAFHANQGPTMGLPQMVQSRAQFGVSGAGLPMIAVIFVYVGFSAFGVLLSSQVLAANVGWNTTGWAFVVVTLAAVLAIFGYDLLHLVLRWLPWIAVPVFGILTYLAVVNLTPNAAIEGAGFNLVGFLGQFIAVVGFQLGYAIIVSDYTRYLPATVSQRGVILWVYGGAALSAIWLIPLGNLLASALVGPDALASLQQVGDFAFSGFGAIAVFLLSVPAAVAIMGINLYGAMLSGIGIAQGFKPQLRLNAKTRIVWIVAGALVVLAVSLGLPEEYLGSFNDFLVIMAYILVPWTAVNLVDYYFVRKGHYSVIDIFNPTGIYGRWGWRGLVSYLVGLVAMFPFVRTSFFSGPLLESIGGFDAAFIVGLVLPAAVYLILTRGFNPQSEDAAIQASARVLDGDAAIRRGTGSGG